MSDFLFDHLELLIQTVVALFVAAILPIARAWWIANRVAANTGQRLPLKALLSLCG
jgi:hypothetical protein